MKHIYRIYECYPDGVEHDTGKTVETHSAERNPQGYLACGNESEITHPVLTTIYGFSNFLTYYHIAPTSNKDKITITYTYPGAEGTKPTWVLKRGR